MHWADVLAEELLARGDEHVLATGITPSGPIHVGNLREVMTTETVHRAVLDAGGEATLIYIADTFDPLRKVYPFLEEHPEIDFAEHVGKPLSDVPSPSGTHQSYAHEFLDPFLAALDDLGIDPVVHLAHELYESGRYEQAIKAALDNADTIKRILEDVSGRDLPEGWLPINVKDEATGRITGTQVLGYDGDRVTYRGPEGHEGSVAVDEPGAIKLPWRVDWPARWSFLGVTFEAFGKDHAAAGGSWDTGQPIAREVFDIEPPHHTVYEFVHVKGKGAMHSSTGTGIAAEDVLQVTPPEVLRFFFERYQPNKHVEFDPGLGLLDLVDEYDRTLVEYHDTGQSGELKDVDRVLALSQPRGHMPEHPGQMPSMRHLSTLVQLYDGLDDVEASLRRARVLTEELSPDEQELLRERVQRTRAWLEHFAPEAVKFEVRDELPSDLLSDDQARILELLANELEDLSWEGDALQDAVYAVAEKADTGAGSVFRAAYLALLGEKRGPRLGPFLASLQRDFVLERFRKAGA